MASAKTSQSHPLRIDTVTAPEIAGVIGLTFCPGKKYHSRYSGEWSRDLSADLQAVQSSGATTLVTLMEAGELERVNVPLAQLRSKAGELGLEWHHLPIRDVSIPNDRFEDLWAYSGVKLHRRLLEGERIVIHCPGGMGRTGTVAARLLIEFGATPGAAINAVRAARPGSIETPEQEAYVRACKPVPSARGIHSKEERALACLLGGAIGDAFGYAVEFDSIGAIRRRFGPKGITEPVFTDERLIVSDDTQMTLFTLEGLLQDSTSSRTESIRLAYLDWLQTQHRSSALKRPHGQRWLLTQPVMYARRAPGNTCMGALGTGGQGTIAKPINDSKGCGGVMRVAPIGLISGPPEPEWTFRLAADAAASTHGHPSGYLSAGVMASIVRSLVEGADLNTALDRSCTILKTYPGHEETLRAIDNALTAARQKAKYHVAAIEKLGGGWVGEEALAIGLYAALSANSFTEVIAIAANHSGDSDSTASIAGQLWGAMNGLDGMPHHWITSLDVLVPLLHLVRRI